MMNVGQLKRCLGINWYRFFTTINDNFIALKVWRNHNLVLTKTLFKCMLVVF